MATNETRTSRLIEKLKNHKFFSIVIVVGIVLVALSGAYKALYDLFDTTTKIQKGLGEHENKKEIIKTAGFSGMEYHLPQQQSPRWGWAASIKAILAYKGVFVAEDELVRSSLPRGTTLTESSFIGSYDNFSLDLTRLPFPRFENLLKFVEEDQPFLVVSEGRAYVFLSITYTDEDNGITVKEIRLGNCMDPSPSQRVIRVSNLSTLINPHVVVAHVTKH